MTKIISVCLTIIFTMQNMVKSLCCEECIFQFKENNWYNVKVYDQPKNSNFTGFCSKPFNNYGTCCDQHDATQYAKNWLKSVKQRVKASTEMLDKFRFAIENLGNVKNYVKKNEEKILKSKAISKKELEDFKIEIEGYTSGVHDFGFREKYLKEDLSGCYEKLIELRAGAVCLRCSGKGSQYYDKATNRLKISKQTCRPIVSSCVRIFSYFAEVTTFFRRVAQLRKSENGTLRQGTRASGLLSKDLNLLRVCASDLKSCTAKEDLYIGVCKLIGLGELTPNIEGEVETFLDGFEAVNLLALGKKIGSRRLLSSGTSSASSSSPSSSTSSSSSPTSSSGGKSHHSKNDRNLIIGFVLPVNEGADFEKQFNATINPIGDFNNPIAFKLGKEKSRALLTIHVYLLVSSCTFLLRV